MQVDSNNDDAAIATVDSDESPKVDDLMLVLPNIALANDVGGTTTEPAVQGTYPIQRLRHPQQILI